VLVVLNARAQVLGFFMTSVLPVGMDLSVEISYPLPEATTSSILLASANLFGIVFTVALTYVLPVSLAASVWALTGVVGLAAVLLLFFRPQNRRLAAEAAAASLASKLTQYGATHE
jgi:FLVCR family feline leukemia virus subgroup C receptor-related protein